MNAQKYCFWNTLIIEKLLLQLKILNLQSKKKSNKILDTYNLSKIFNIKNTSNTFRICAWHEQDLVRKPTPKKGSFNKRVYMNHRQNHSYISISHRNISRQVGCSSLFHNIIVDFQNKYMENAGLQFCTYRLQKVQRRRYLITVLNLSLRYWGELKLSQS